MRGRTLGYEARGQDKFYGPNAWFAALAKRFAKSILCIVLAEGHRNVGTSESENVLGLRSLGIL